MQIIDRRRMSRSKTAENRSRFIKRYKEALKKSIADTFMNKKLADSATSGGEVKINGKTLDEPTIYHGQGGTVDRVLPGNQHYSEGDLLPKQKSGSSQGSGDPSDSGEGFDDFTIMLDNKEFLDLLFDDLELPNLVQTMLTSSKVTSFKNAGFTSDGNPSSLSIIKTYKQALGRRICIRGSIEEELLALGERIENDLNGKCNPVNREHHRIDEELEPELEAAYALYDELQARHDNVPLFDEHDLRYRAKTKIENPTTHATMIMLMDNSGSMGEREKTIARKFFLLLYLFLKRSYEAVDMVFISHTTTAREMSEEEFFSTHDSGGTVVSSGLDLMHEIIDARLVEKTNIYVAQVSDGDNVDTDNGTCVELLEDDILPHTRYFAYVQVDDYHVTDESTDPYLSTLRSFGKGLWKAYDGLAKRTKRFNVKRVSHEREIYPVFRELFSRQEK